jgi:hypothetical protein
MEIVSIAARRRKMGFCSSLCGGRRVFPLLLLMVVVVVLMVPRCGW